MSSDSKPCSHTHGIINLLCEAKPHPTEKGMSIVPTWALKNLADSIEDVKVLKAGTPTMDDYYDMINRIIKDGAGLQQTKDEI